MVRLTDGWGDTYQKKAAVVRLARADLQTLGLKENGQGGDHRPGGVGGGGGQV